LLLAAGAAGAPGCKKDDHQSLVIVNLKLGMADTRANGPLSVTLAATPGPRRTYPMTTLSATTALQLGLYLPGSVTGDVSLMATATLDDGCVGFSGSGSVTVNAPGATLPPVTITMQSNTCPGGTGGTTGTAGTGGMAGTTGTGGMAGTTGTGGRGGTGGTSTGTGGTAGYPSIAACRPFNHTSAAACASGVTVDAVAVAANGQMVASAGSDGRVKIWSFDGRALTATGMYFNDFIGYGLAFSPDGTRLAYTSGNATNIVRTYAVSGWVAGPTLVGDGQNDSLAGVAWTPDSRRIVSVDDKGNGGGKVYVHDFAGTGTAALTALVPKEPWSITVSPRAAADGSVAVAVGTYYSTVTLLTLTTNALTVSPTTLDTRATNSPVDVVRFSPDGTVLAEGDDNGALRMWHFPITSATPFGDSVTFAGGDTIHDIAFTPDGMYAAVGGAFFTGQLSIYNASTQAEAAHAPTPQYNVQSLAFTPNGGALIAGEDDCGIILICN